MNYWLSLSCWRCFCSSSRLEMSSNTFLRQKSSIEIYFTIDTNIIQTQRRCSCSEVTVCSPFILINVQKKYLRCHLGFFSHEDVNNDVIPYLNITEYIQTHAACPRQFVIVIFVNVCWRFVLSPWFTQWFYVFVHCVMKSLQRFCFSRLSCHTRSTEPEPNAFPFTTVTTATRSRLGNNLDSVCWMFYMLLSHQEQISGGFRAAYGWIYCSSICSAFWPDSTYSSRFNRNVLN